MLKRILTLLVLGSILAVLMAWERSLSERQAESRRESIRISQFFDASVLEGRPLAAMRLRAGDGRSAVYLYDEPGMWRVLSAYGVPARQSEVNTILPRLVDGRGVIRTLDPDDPGVYGIGTERTLRLTLHGERIFDDPDGDAIYMLEIGHPIPATGGSYVRVGGEGAIWAVDFNLRDVLEPDPQSPLPPMVDLRLIPEAWIGVHEGVGRIHIERPGEPPIMLYRSEVDITPEQREQGMPNWQWLITQGDATVPADPTQVLGYSMFLMRITYAGILSPGDRPELGFEQPRGVISMQSAGGDALQLIFGQHAPRGGLPVFNTFTQASYEMRSELEELFFPDIALLRGREHGMPWEPWMRRDDDHRGRMPAPNMTLPAIPE